MATTIFTKQAERSFLKLKASDQKKISKAIEKLMKNPLAGEKLKGEFEGQYKLYAWPYRVIYVFYPKNSIVTVVDIGHRQGIYK